MLKCDALQRAERILPNQKTAVFGFIATLVAVGGLFLSHASADGPELCKAAPPLTLSKLLQAPANAAADWEALRGKVVVLEFWATTCGPCRESIPHWNELVAAFKPKPVQFIAVTDEEQGAVLMFLKQTPIRSWVGLSKAGQSLRGAYRIQGIPTSVIVNQRGIVVAVVHPAALEPTHIQEVLRTGKSSLPPPAQLFAWSLSDF
jgi:thiol-disulfide isomerase/thioredoxin